MRTVWRVARGCAVCRLSVCCGVLEGTGLLVSDVRESRDDPVEVTEETTVTERTEVADGGWRIPPEMVPPAPVPGAPVEMAGPRVVSETENVRLEEDGSITRRADRVEHAPVRRRPPSLVPALVAILVLALGAIAAAWYLTRSDTKDVPAVEGLALDDAVARMQDAGFRTDIVSEASDAPQGTVFRQGPAAGTDAEGGSTVQLFTSKGPATVSVPNAVGVTEAEARDRLAAAGLQPSVYQVFSDKPEREVVAQSPAAGSKAADGSRVRLNVSKGTGLVDVPSLVGRSQGEAVSELQSVGLKANVVMVPSREPAGTVVAQHPVAGQARQGSAVRLNVSRGP